MGRYTSMGAIFKSYTVCKKNQVEDPTPEGKLSNKCYDDWDYM